MVFPALPSRKGVELPLTLCLLRRLLPNRCTCCHTACMPSITVRDVPDATRDELAARAARQGRSLQEYLRKQLIDLADRPDPELLARRVVERKHQTSTRLAASKILEHRDAGRR